jgi:hypothetical protein
MLDPHELAARFRTEADAYEGKARAMLSIEGRDLLIATAATYRRLADRLETRAPRWMGKPE